MDSHDQVHPSAIGSATKPSPPPSQSQSPESHSQPDSSYPEQLHAGKVGYGPAYHQGPGVQDKIKGLAEEVKGKITRNPVLVEQGKERVTGELKHKQREQELNSNDPFAKPEEKKQQDPAGEHDKTSDEHGLKEQAATVAPRGTQEGETQRKGEAVDNIKHIG